MKGTKYHRNVLLILFSIMVNWSAYSIDPQFIGDLNQESTTGYYLLKWQQDVSAVAEDKIFVLQQSADNSFSQNKVIYEGPDYASFISGLKNGKYYFRVGYKEGTQITWSEHLVLSVNHHSLKMSFILFGAGLLIFIATVMVIVVGNLKYNK